MTYYIWRDHPSSQYNSGPYLFATAPGRRLAVKFIVLALVDNPRSRAWLTEKNDPHHCGENSKNYWHNRYKNEGLAFVNHYLYR